jgi:hypothetical protein
MNVAGNFTITLHVNPTDTPAKFASDLDKAIEGLKRMKAAMFAVKKQPRKTRRQR